MVMVYAGFCGILVNQCFLYVIYDIKLCTENAEVMGVYSMLG